ncbi:hypothetical protein ACJX0J_035200, partial [Zea mays]
VALESGRIQTAINDVILNLFDKFFEMQRNDIIRALNMYKREIEQHHVRTERHECSGRWTVTCAPTNTAMAEVASRVLGVIEESGGGGGAATKCFFGDVVLFGNKDRMAVLDPTYKEEAVMAGRMTAIVNSNGDVCAIQKAGGEAQSNRHAVLGASESRPDLILTGHKENEEFALAMCPAEPYVLSGGKDKSVVLWSIQDHISALGDSSSSPGASGSKQSVKTANEKESPKLILEVYFMDMTTQLKMFSSTLPGISATSSKFPRFSTLSPTTMPGTLYGGEFDAVKPLKQSRVGFRGQAWFHINFWARPRSSSSNNKTIKRFFAEVHYKPTSISSPSSSSSSLAITAVPIVQICIII